MTGVTDQQIRDAFNVLGQLIAEQLIARSQTNGSSVDATVQEDGPTLTADRWMYKAEVCKYLGVSRQTVTRLVERGKLPEPERTEAGKVWWRQSTIDQLLGADVEE